MGLLIFVLVGENLENLGILLQNPALPALVVGGAIVKSAHRRSPDCPPCSPLPWWRRPSLRDLTQRGAHWQARFEHVLVDEFQHVDDAQLELVGILAEPRRNVFVVGGDDQSSFKITPILASPARRSLPLDVSAHAWLDPAFTVHRVTNADSRGGLSRAGHDPAPMLL